MTVFRHSAATHVGCVRKLNEDAILALPAHRIWAVADGMGGHEGGDFASRAVTDAIAALPVDLAPAGMMAGLRDAILSAHECILAESDRRARGPIGATVVALILSEDHFAAFWAGDSRLYSFRAGQLDMLSTDHSMVAELVAAGGLSWEEAEQLPHANVITRAVGVGAALDLDKIRGRLAPGERFLLCSDGLTRHVGGPELAGILGAAPLEHAADALVARALAAGGSDNVSAIVVEVAG
ncbi:PP2C family protein-serine/threonine phosphatase [Mangrovicoccus algicola]|uniref:Serine/threonine-protein phosphatase n=1 Tax=Mangrovicoccus algicola TaxID=2771008 RepID=A0A8J6Z020_9RHOB|nr:protein phosphatase 2C domain-containing protein [Mangrovicoccus algicola]MBE3639053.1 serine/threonine-protein phosphatase [Mangrovicoccus algicola]